jgi:hypothetical protein
MKRIKFLRLQFLHPIAEAELPKFRGAIIGAVEREHSLFHNHLGEDRLRYAYPLIQYKREGGKPVLVCLNEGTAEIHALFREYRHTVRLGHRFIELQVEAVDTFEWELAVSPQLFDYQIHNWLALSGENYGRYRVLHSAEERNTFLANILRGNLLAMAKGLGWYVEQQVKVSLHTVGPPRPVRYKNTQLIAFDAFFSANIDLPSSIGLGKGAAKGFGVVQVHRPVGAAPAVEAERAWSQRTRS